MCWNFDVKPWRKVVCVPKDEDGGKHIVHQINRMLAPAASTRSKTPSMANVVVEDGADLFPALIASALYGLTQNFGFIQPCLLTRTLQEGIYRAPAFQYLQLLRLYFVSTSAMAHRFLHGGPAAGFVLFTVGGFHAYMEQQAWNSIEILSFWLESWEGICYLSGTNMA